MSGDEDEVGEEPFEPVVPPAKGGTGVESVGAVASPSPAIVSTATAADEKRSSAYWQAVISALSPEKQAAAWQFFQERELGLAKGATDTLSGLVLLLEANGLFMEACAKRLADIVVTVGPRNEREDGTKILPVLEGIHGDQNDQKSSPVVHPAASADAPPAPLEQMPTLAKAARWTSRAPAVWCFAALLALVAGGIGWWMGERQARAVAELQVAAQVRQIRTWLDVDEQARAILMSQKGELTFGFARDPSLGNRKVYTLTVKGVPILRAGKTREGAGVIAFDSGGPDLIP